MSEHIISAEALSKVPSDQVVIVDCRFSLADVNEGKECYAQGHISGAHYLHLDDDLSGAKAEHGGRHPLPDIETLHAKLQAIGVNERSLVVAYDDQAMAFASRLWWLMRYLGHGNVKVLDGGFKAWLQQGFACDSQVPSTDNGSFVAKPCNKLLVDRAAVIGRESNTLLVDSREAPRFKGEQEPIDPIAGHIDGAVNYPWRSVTDEKAFFHVEQQHTRWQAVIDHDDIIVYCGSGVTACVNLLSLAEAGRDDAKLYAGSWSDWCSYL